MGALGNSEAGKPEIDEKTSDSVPDGTRKKTGKIENPPPKMSPIFLPRKSAMNEGAGDDSIAGAPRGASDRNLRGWSTAGAGLGPFPCWASTPAAPAVRAHAMSTTTGSIFNLVMNMVLSTSSVSSAADAEITPIAPA